MPMSHKIALFLLLWTATASAQPGAPMAAGATATALSATRLQALLDQKDFFRLKTALEREGPRLSAEERAYFQAYADNVFARNDWSLKTVRALLDGRGITEKQRYNLWRLQEDNYYKLGLYKQAVACCDSLLQFYRNMMDTADQRDLANDRL